MDIEVGTLMRYTVNPNGIWKVTRVSDKSVWLARCDERGRFSSYAPREWPFRRATVQRDFHPA